MRILMSIFILLTQCNMVTCYYMGHLNKDVVLLLWVSGG